MTLDDKFSIPIQKHGSEETRSTLRRLVLPFILRRTKGEVLKELPARTEISPGGRALAGRARRVRVGSGKRLCNL